MLVQEMPATGQLHLIERDNEPYVHTPFVEESLNLLRWHLGVVEPPQFKLVNAVRGIR